MTITVRKITKNQSYETEGFTETKEWVLMHCSNVDGNNNKYYCMEIQYNSDADEHRIYTEYGRLGNDPARNFRDGLTLEEAEKEFNRLKKSKGREKTKTSAAGKYKEKYEVVDIPAPSVGSPNIKVGDGESVTKKVNGGSFQNVFSQMDYDNETQRLLKSLLASNIHNIESKTSITVTRNGQLETALGSITIPHIDSARNVLNQILAESNLDASNDRVRKLNTQYLSLVPRQVGRIIDEGDMILDGDKANEEFDLLSGMEAALKVGTQTDEDKPKKPDLGMDIELVTDGKLSKQVISQFEKTRKHGDVSDWKPKRVFGIFNTAEQKKYHLPVADSDEVDLFHGSATSNILSIMMNGYYVPPSSASHVTGRMFGNGVYGASCSTKAFRYAVGLWGGNRGGNRAYCFVVRFAMGKTYNTNTTQYSGAPKGYHSIHAKAGSSLLNDEYIVYNTNQTKNLYLIELEKR